MYTVIQAEFTKNRKKDKYGVMKFSSVFVMTTDSEKELQKWVDSAPERQLDVVRGKHAEILLKDECNIGNWDFDSDSKGVIIITGESK